MTDTRFVTVRAAQPPLSVTAMLGATPPVTSDGYGGWDLQPRPRLKDLTIWSGIRPLRTLFTIILGVRPGPKGATLDGFALGVSALKDRTTLERMAQPPAPGGEPPLLTVTAPVPHASDGPWVIESFDWDPNPLYLSNGQLARHSVTVHLLQYVRDDQLADLTAAQSARLNANIASSTAAKKNGGVSPKNKLYIVKAGDTLQTIAARQLGQAKRYTEIATLNSLAPKTKLTPGQKLRLP